MKEVGIIVWQDFSVLSRQILGRLKFSGSKLMFLGVLFKERLLSQPLNECLWTYNRLTIV